MQLRLSRRGWGLDLEISWPGTGTNNTPRLNVHANVSPELWLLIRERGIHLHVEGDNNPRGAIRWMLVEPGFVGHVLASVGLVDEAEAVDGTPREDSVDDVFLGFVQRDGAAGLQSVPIGSL